MAKIKKLKSDNEYTYPVTVEKAIYDSNGNRLDNKLATFAKSSEVNTRFASVENSISTITSDLGDAWDPSITYKVGDYCIYSNALYKCKVQNSNIVPTNTTYWTRVKVGNELGTINRDLAYHKEEISGGFTFATRCGIVNMRTRNWTNVTIGENYIPEAYRCGDNLFVKAQLAFGSGWGMRVGILQFSPDGQLRAIRAGDEFNKEATNLTSGSAQVLFNTTYIIP